MSIQGDLGGIAKPEEWMKFGECQYVDAELFHPPRGHPAVAAKRICLSCSVLAECREYAITSPHHLDGIWGALGARERQNVRALRRQDAA